MRANEPEALDVHWVNTCDRWPDYDKEVYVLVVDSRGGNIEYARAKLSKAGWAFTTKAPYSKIVAWIEPDNVSFSGDEISRVPKDMLRY